MTQGNREEVVGDREISHAESIQNIHAVRRGLEAVKNGETIPAEEVFAEVRDALGLDAP